MCVILICPPKVRPSRRLLELCELGNPHGAGIAWREAGMVHWFKTDTLDQIELLARRKAGEIVIHFRIASVGGVTPALRHPFPVSPRAGLATAGSARTVLFQNGTWLGWQEALERAGKAGLEIPGGEWSDTRAAALLAHGTTAAERAEFFGQVASPSRWVWFAARGTEAFGAGVDRGQRPPTLFAYGGCGPELRAGDQGVAGGDGPLAVASGGSARLPGADPAELGDQPDPARLDPPAAAPGPVRRGSG